MCDLELKRAACLIGLAVAFCVLAPRPSTAQVTSAGKNTAAMAAEFDPSAGCIQDVSIGTMGKGKRGTLVTVQITASNLPEGFPGARISAPKVNERQMEGPSSVDGPDSSQFTNGAVSAVWWLDLDQAGSAEPGEFVGVPLAIVIDQLCGSDAYHVTTVAQVVKK